MFGSKYILGKDYISHPHLFVLIAISVPFKDVMRGRDEDRELKDVTEIVQTARAVGALLESRV